MDVSYVCIIPYIIFINYWKPPSLHQWRGLSYQLWQLQTFFTVYSSFSNRRFHKARLASSCANTRIFTRKECLIERRCLGSGPSIFAFTSRERRLPFKFRWRLLNVLRERPPSKAQLYCRLRPVFKYAAILRSALFPWRFSSPCNLLSIKDKSDLLGPVPKSVSVHS